MTDAVLKSVHTKAVGFAPILRHFLEKCGIIEIIDAYIPPDPRRKILSHGEASAAMITAIMFQVMQLYRLCQFANETNTLDAVLPGIDPKEYFDDRPADTLDAIFIYGIGNLETLITTRMIDEFGIESDICRNDTASGSVYGDCDNNKTPGSIKLTFGCSKKHRQDLKQFVWSLSVSSDNAFPLFQKAYSGNTADVTTYAEQWQNLIDLLGRRDFLYAADSKLITVSNMVHIHSSEGFFIAPAPMYETYKTVLHQAVDKHSSEELIAYKEQFNRGFEVPLTVINEEEEDDKEYTFRMIILYDQKLAARKRRGLQNRADKTKAAFEELAAKLNKYRLKTEEAISKACEAILKKNKTGDFFDCIITNDPEITWKNKKRGRVPKHGKVEKIPIITDKFSIRTCFNEAAYEKELYRCGYYPLITNKPKEDLTVRDAMTAHKNQYKCEHTNRRAKSSCSLEPIYLHTPERIEAFLFLFKTALQIIVLMERTAGTNINKRDKGLDNFMPNRKDVRNPRTENLLLKFQHVVKGEVPLPDGNTQFFVSDLTPLQIDILSILEVPVECYTYEYLFGP